MGVLLDLARAIALSIVLVSPAWAVLFLVTGPLVHVFHPTVHSHSDVYRFRERPADDSRLRAWVAEQPGLADPLVEREGERLTIRYDSREEASLEPPWEELGYGDQEGTNRGSLAFGAIRVSASTYAFAWLQMSVAGLGLATIRRRRRAPPTAGFGSRRGPDALLGAGIGAASYGLACLYALPFGEALGASGSWSIVQVIPAWEGWSILALAVPLAPLCLEPFLCERASAPLEARGRPRAAMWTFAGAFALLQGQPGLLPVHLALGLGLAWSWRRTAAWTAPVVAHATFLLVSIGVPLGMRGGLGGAFLRVLGGA